MTSIRARLATISASTMFRNVAETYVVQVLRILASVCANIAVARTLLPEGRGHYAVGMAIAVLATQFGSMGLGTANLYYSARHPQMCGKLLGNSVVLGGVLGAALVAVVIAMRRFFPSAVDVNPLTFGFALLYIPFGIWYTLLQGLLLGKQRVRDYNRLELLNRVLPLAMLLALVLFRSNSAALSVGCFFASQLFCAVSAYAQIHRQVAVEFSLETVRQTLKYGLRINLAVVFAFVIFRADLLMVASIRGAAQAGYYSLATSIAEYTVMPATVVGTLLTARLSERADYEEKFRIMTRWLKAVAVALMPLVLLAIALGKPMIALLFGGQYLPAYTAFALLAPGVFFLGLASVAVSFITSIGYRMSVPFVWFVCAVINIGGNLYAIPRYGMNGASVLSSICYALSFCLILLLCRRYRREKKDDGTRIEALSGAAAGAAHP